MKSIPSTTAYTIERPDVPASYISPITDIPSFLTLLENALNARAGLLDDRHEITLRLFNGFYEGCPELIIDLYAQTAIIFNHADEPSAWLPVIQAVQERLQLRFPWLRAVILKTRKAPDLASRRGVMLYGEQADQKICEHGVWYAIDAFISQDASFYLDTRQLRLWTIQTLAGKRVLNTFAYTGSLGIAAMAGGALRVVQMDQNRIYLNLAKASASLNGFQVDPGDFLNGDFWTLVNRLKRADQLFECVIIDPPFFSVTDKGRVDLVHQSHRVINKVRPLVCHDGYLVVVNNALFVSGAEFLSTLESLCATGYVSIEAFIPVPLDVTGYPHTRQRTPPVDPAPFNHPTKIAILHSRRKDGRVE
jgi:23S rRNA (cytosine1962-C5)-methyltransferase